MDDIYTNIEFFKQNFYWIGIAVVGMAIYRYLQVG